MHSPFRFATSSWAIALVLLLAACSKKNPECQSLIASMNELGTKLSEAQKVTSNQDAKPEQVAAALRPFASAAKSTGEKLASGPLSVPELKRIATDAARAALALAANSTNMAEAAEQMKGLDSASKAVEDQKRAIDSAEAEIKRLCDGNPKLCTNLAKVLVTFPPPPDKADNPHATADWATKLNAWAAELGHLQIVDPQLKVPVTAFENGWRNFAVAMTTLVGISEMAKRYDEFAKAFNTQIDAVNKSVGEANGFCKS